MGCGLREQVFVGLNHAHVAESFRRPCFVCLECKKIFFTQRNQNSKPATVLEAGRAVDVAVSLYGREMAMAPGDVPRKRPESDGHRVC